MGFRVYVKELFSTSLLVLPCNSVRHSILFEEGYRRGLGFRIWGLEFRALTSGLGFGS